jgi:hypothetical protein
VILTRQIARVELTILKRSGRYRLGLRSRSEKVGLIPVICARTLLSPFPSVPPRKMQIEIERNIYYGLFHNCILTF